MNNIVVISAEILTKMMSAAELQCARFARNIGQYGHNNPDSTVTSYMAEYAVRELYRQGGVQAIQNINDTTAPDLTIPAHRTMSCEFDIRQEEVKCWKSGYSWNNYGYTITAYHAERYERKGRARVWFCEVNRETSTVIVHGWATPAECLLSDTTVTSSGLNHTIKTPHPCSEVMAWITDVDIEGGWFE